MSELENMETTGTEPEAPQEAQETPVTGAEEQGGQTDTPEAEAPQEAQEAPVTGAEEQGGQTDTPEAEAPQEAQETPVTDTERQGEEQPEPVQPLLRFGLGGTVTPAVVTPTPVLLNNSAAEATAQETDEEYNTILVNELETVKLGRQGEHLTQQVLIDCTAWLTNPALSGCTLLIAAIRPGETEIYLPTVTTSDGVITWDIQDQDTAKGGWGRGEVRAMKDGKIKKSAVFRTRIEPSLEGSGSAPITPPDWVQTILDSVAAAQAAAEAAAASAAQAELNTRGLAGWSLTVETDETVTIDYHESEE